MDEGRLSNITSALPATHVHQRRARPAVGQVQQWRPVMLEQLARQVMEVPLPLEAMFSLPGLALAALMNSCTLVTPRAWSCRGSSPSR